MLTRRYCRTKQNKTNNNSILPTYHTHTIPSTNTPPPNETTGLAGWLAGPGTNERTCERRLPAHKRRRLKHFTHRPLAHSHSPLHAGLFTWSMRSPAAAAAAVGTCVETSSMIMTCGRAIDGGDSGRDTGCYC
jgi:hypothetical protein